MITEMWRVRASAALAVSTVLGARASEAQEAAPAQRRADGVSAP